jgi:hypothetical protein
MPSPLRDRAFNLIHDIRSIFINEFNLLTPFLYEDVQPGERYGLISFEEFDVDPELQAKDYFKVIRGEIILTFGYSSQDDAEISPIQVMFDLDNFRGALYQQLNSTQNLFFDFQIKGAMSRALRQPVRNPDVWISDVTASSVVRMGIYKTATGAHIP